jgi:hypothetical protein
VAHARPVALWEGEIEVDQIQILKRAFQISWKYRALWLIGLLLVLAGGGVTSLSRGGVPSPGPNPEVSGGGQEWQGLPGQASRLWAEIATIVAILIVVLLAITAFFVLIGIARIVLRYMMRTSLIQMVDQYEETGEELSVGSGLKLGWSRTSFRLFLIGLVLKLPIALLIVGLIALGIGLAVASFIIGTGPWIVLGVILILLVIPIGMLGVGLGILVNPLIQVTYRACAIDGLGVWDAIRSAFGLIGRNLGPTALQWLLLVGLGIAWRIALIPINLLLVVLAFLIGGIPGAVVGGIGGLIGGWPWGLGAGLLVFVPLFILVVALPNLALDTAATVYRSAVWTLAYRELRVIDAGKRDVGT